MTSHTTAGAILVVDDCESICELIEMLLLGEGYQVRSATTAADAMRVANEMPQIHMALCGLELPDMPGEELAVEISAIHPTAAIVFVSASYGLNDSMRASMLLEKPFSIDELRSAVRSALRTTRTFAESPLSATL